LRVLLASLVYVFQLLFFSRYPASRDRARFAAAFQFEEPFRQAAEKDRLLAVVPVFSTAPLFPTS